MKRKYLFTSLLLVLTSCNNSNDTINDMKSLTYKEYVEMINNQKNDDKCIIIFTQPNCAYCRLMNPYLKVYIEENNIDYIYNINIAISNNDFVDKTMGTYKDDNNDLLKKLDSRIELYKRATNVDNLLYTTTETYAYIFTPLIIWYKNGIEVKISNNFYKELNEDVNNEKFASFMQFPTNNPSWSKTFDLTYNNQ